MTEEKRDFRRTLQEFTVKALKATIKGILLYGIYLVLTIFMTPVSEIVPSFQQKIETFIMIYICLMVVGELSAGTIFQHFLSAAKALFVIFYLIFALRSGVIGVTFQNVNLVVDLRLFLVTAMLLSLVGFAKSMLQTINFLNEKAESPHI